MISIQQWAMMYHDLHNAMSHDLPWLLYSNEPWFTMIAIEQYVMNYHDFYTVIICHDLSWLLCISVPQFYHGIIMQHLTGTARLISSAELGLNSWCPMSLFIWFFSAFVISIQPVNTFILLVEFSFTISLFKLDFKWWYECQCHHSEFCLTYLSGLTNHNLLHMGATRCLQFIITIKLLEMVVLLKCYSLMLEKKHNILSLVFIMYKRLCEQKWYVWTDRQTDRCMTTWWQSWYHLHFSTWLTHIILY